MSKSENINLFTPLKIRDCVFQNRIGVPPMILFNAVDGKPQDIHLIQYGKYALDAYGFIIFESTAIEPNGRSTLKDCGIWSDDFIPDYKRITDFVHKYGSKIGIQLNHCGRKASGSVPSIEKRKGFITLSEGGWNVVGASSLKYSEDWNDTKELSINEIQNYIKLFVECAIRCVKSGFDFIEIHGAHGFLINQFISPLTNNRSDEYGGSFNNRIRFLKEVIIEVRKVIPNNMPLFVRLSCEDLCEGGITISDTINIVNEIKDLGVDLINCSGGGVVANQTIPSDPLFEVVYAKKVKESTGILTAAVGGICSSELANNLIENKEADVVLIGRAALRGAFYPRHAAADIGTDIPPYHQNISYATTPPRYCKY
uniref:NADH-dependent flavin oxidoreductase n=1 Tax=Opalinidae sp. TaxID=2059444 RepID=A0A649UYW9_9STRA|nr:NADH-dependent flavin oxidoreductase [Opalinidae sp.]